MIISLREVLLRCSMFPTKEKKTQEIVYIIRMDLKEIKYTNFIEFETEFVFGHWWFDVLCM